MRHILFAAVAALTLTSGAALAQDAGVAAPAAPQAPVAAPAAMDPAQMSAHDHHRAQHDASGVGAHGAHPVFGATHLTRGKHPHKCKKHCHDMANAGKMDQAHLAHCLTHCEEGHHHPSNTSANKGAAAKNMK